LKKENIKILIFDEGKIGKRTFYTEWVGQELSKKLIFAEGLSLRKAICLIGNKLVKLIFGPSTGLLHCASGIYNVFCERGLPLEEIPIMLSYIGNDKVNYQEDLWWGNSLVDAILLVNDGNSSKEIKSIKEIDFKKLKESNSFYTSQAFTSEAILNYIRNTYNKKLDYFCLS
jgi:hypothetical protein